MTIVLLPAVSGTRVWSLVDTDGVEHALNLGTHYLPTLGASGLWVPEFDFSIEQRPFDVGGQLKRSNARDRVVDFPIYISGDSELQIHQRIESLPRWLNPIKGDSYLKVTRPDGASRRLKCRGTIQVAESQDARFPQQGQMVVATLTCPEPYWEDADAQDATYAIDVSPLTWFNSPTWFPFYLSGSTVLDSPIIENDGDIDTYPVWTINGPGSDPVLRNLTTGKLLSLDLDIAAGRQVIIDTSAGVKSITDGLGTNLYGQRVGESSLWPLVPGVQTLQVELNGASSASSVELTYRRRWMSC